MSTQADRLGWVVGEAVERRYRERAPAYFGSIARRLRPLSYSELDALLDQAVADGVMDDDQAEDLRCAEAVLRGRLRETGREAYLVVEASYGVGVDDVERAARRAELLRRVGVEVIAIAAGEWVTHAAQQAAPAHGVWQVTDGQVVRPDGEAA